MPSKLACICEVGEASSSSSSGAQPKALMKVARRLPPCAWSESLARVAATRLRAAAQAPRGKERGAGEQSQCPLHAQKNMSTLRGAGAASHPGLPDHLTGEGVAGKGLLGPGDAPVHGLFHRIDRVGSGAAQSLQLGLQGAGTGCKGCTTSSTKAAESPGLHSLLAAPALRTASRHETQCTQPAGAAACTPAAGPTC